MKSFPFDSHVTYKDDGTPVFDRAVDSAVYRSLLKKLFTTGILSTDSTNMQVTTNEDMTVNVLSGFAMVEGVMNLHDETVTLEVEASDANYARIDSVVLRLNTNDNFRNCDFYIVKGTPSEVPVRPDLTREIAVYELGLADIYVSAGATSITADNIADTRYEEERCGVVMASGDISRYIDDIQSTIDEIVASLTSENYKKFKFGYSSDLDKYGCNVDGNFLPFGGTKIIIDGEEAMNNISMILTYKWGAAFATNTTKAKNFSAVDGSGNIHLIGDKGNTGDNSWVHHQYSQGAWSTLTDFSKPFFGGCALTDIEGNITLFVSSYYSSDGHNIAIYKYINGAWVQGLYPVRAYVENFMSEVYAALAPNGNIHVIFYNTYSSGKSKSHFVYNNDGSWSEIGTAPGVGPVVVDKSGNLHMFVYTSSSRVVTHYVYKNGSWSNVETMSEKVAVSFAFLDTNGVINVFQGNKHYKYVSGKWKFVGEITDVTPSNAFVVDGELTAVGTTSSKPYVTKLYKASGSLIMA